MVRREFLVEKGNRRGKRERRRKEEFGGSRSGNWEITVVMCCVNTFWSVTDHIDNSDTLRLYHLVMLQLS